MSTDSRETIAKKHAKFSIFLRKKMCCLSPRSSDHFSDLFGGPDRFDLQWRRAPVALYQFATVTRPVKKRIQGMGKKHHFRNVIEGTLPDPYFIV